MTVCWSTLQHLHLLIKHPDKIDFGASTEYFSGQPCLETQPRSPPTPAYLVVPALTKDAFRGFTIGFPILFLPIRFVRMRTLLLLLLSALD